MLIRTLGCNCATALVQLREAFVSLLILEQKSQQWYSECYHAYIYYMCKRIEQRGLETAESLRKLLSSLVPTTSGGSKDCDTLNIKKVLDLKMTDSHVKDLICIINDEVTTIQNILFAIPENASAIPMAPTEFLNYKNTYNNEMGISNAPTLDSDGIEFIDPP
jgi:hypothetical protein